MSKNILTISEDKIKELKDDYNNFNTMYGFKKIKPIYIYFSATILSLIWIGIIAYYTNNSIYNWSSLFKMLPHEFGGFLAGTIFPLGLIWMIALYIDRNINSNYEHEVIYPFLQSIIDPHGDTSVITKVITKKVETETDILKKTIDKFMDYSNKLASVHSTITDKVNDAMSAMKEHEKSMKNITENLNDSTNSIDSKVKNILQIISDNIKILIDTTDSTEQKTNNITTNLANETAKLEITLDKTSEIVNTISKTIDTNTFAITNSTKEALTKTKEIEEAFDTIGNRVITSTEIAETRANQILNNIENKSNEFIEKSNIAAERINNISDNITKSIDTIEQLSSDHKQATTSTIFTIKQQSDYMIENLTNQANRFENKTDSILETVSHTQQKFQDINNEINNIIAKISAELKNLENEKEAFVSSITNIKEIANQTSSDIKNSSNDIISTTTDIKVANENISKIMKDGNQNLQAQASIANKITNEIKNTLTEAVNNLEKTLNSAKTNSRLSEEAIKEQGALIEDKTENFINNIRSISTQLSGEIKKTLDLPQIVLEKFNAINDTIVAKNLQATNLIKDGIAQGVKFSKDFQEISTSFFNQSNKNNNDISQNISNLRQHSVILNNANETTKEILANISKEIAKISGIIPSLNTNIDTINSKLQTSNTSIEQSVKATNSNTIKLAENLNIIEKQFSKFAEEKASEMQYIANTSKQSIVQIAEYTNKLTNEAKNTIEDLKNQLTNISNINKKEEPISTDKFLNTTGFIIEKLNELSIDISNILTPDVSQDLWNQYNAGNRSVFTKYLTKILSKQKIDNLKKEVQTNKTLASYVISFINQYSDILEKAKHTEKREILLPTLTSTEIGKLYLLLKELV